MPYLLFEIDAHHHPEWDFLFNFPSAPSKIYIQTKNAENLNLLKNSQKNGLAIVGTRKPSERILQFISEQLFLLKNTSIFTLSGFAVGVDQRCHEASIQNKIPTIAILGCGLHKIYPKNSESLRNLILENGGLIISEFEPDAPPIASHFIKRNRLIAAWSRCVWIAESKIPSGALNTAYWARQYDKTCYSTPSFPNDPYTFGNQKLLDDFQAEPFWGAHSLGSTWLELSTIRHSKVKSIHLSKNEKLSILMIELKSHIQKFGFISLNTLIDKLIEKNKTYNEAFELIQCAKDEKLIQINFGIIEIIHH